jgi:hypothetical protein
MISIMTDGCYGFLDISFPNVKVFLLDFVVSRVSKCVCMHPDELDLQHWMLVAIRNIRHSEFVELADRFYVADSYSRFNLYSVIRSRSYSDFRRKIRRSWGYIRSFDDRLSNLRWVSPKMCVNEFDEIVSLSSPILLFGMHRGCIIAKVWFSGLLSLLSRGCLEARSSFHFFSLGTGYNY